MAEIPIRRVNFFDGQFLKQGEFLDLDAYHRHMRRRWAYVMFDKTGVVQANPGDLTLQAMSPGTNKVVLVKAGMAIVKNDQTKEGKELVLPEDKTIDLNTFGPFANTDVAIVTLRYKDRPILPSVDSDVPGDTRIDEEVHVEVHKNTVPATSTLPLEAGDSYVVLGGFEFGSMGASAIAAAARKVALLNAGLIAAAPTPASITLTPNTGAVGGVLPPIEVAATGFTMTGVTAANVSVSPSAGITINSAVVDALDNTKLDLTLDVQPPANGPVTITVTKGATSASATFTVLTGLVFLSASKVNEPGAVTDIVLTGVGLTAGALTSIEFFGAGPAINRTISIPAGQVTSTTITFPMASIPTAAQSGLATINHPGGPKQLHIDLPASTTTNLAGTLQVGDPLAIAGQRFVLPRIRMFRGGVQFYDSQTAGFPNPASGESLTATNIVLQIPSSVGAGVSVQIETAGGTILVPGTFKINP
jgi:hypothetical protein